MDRSSCQVLIENKTGFAKKMKFYSYLKSLHVFPQCFSEGGRRLAVVPEVQGKGPLPVQVLACIHLTVVCLPYHQAC